MLRAWCAYLDSPESPVSSRTAQTGARVRTGDALGYFSCGGSSMALVLRPGAIEQVTVANRPSTTNPDDGPPIRVNAQIAAAR